MTFLLIPGAERAGRVRSAQQRHHANAVAVWQGGDPFGVILRRGPREALGMVGAYVLACRLPADMVPGVAQGEPIEIDQVAYRIAEPPQPDESGWLLLQLEVA